MEANPTLSQVVSRSRDRLIVAHPEDAQAFLRMVEIGREVVRKILELWGDLKIDVDQICADTVSRFIAARDAGELAISIEGAHAMTNERVGVRDALEAGAIEPDALDGLSTPIAAHPDIRHPAVRQLLADFERGSVVVQLSDINRHDPVAGHIDDHDILQLVRSPEVQAARSLDLSGYSSLGGLVQKEGVEPPASQLFQILCQQDWLHLERLILRCTGLNNLDARNLAEAVRQGRFSELRELDVSFNGPQNVLRFFGIDNKGAKELLALSSDWPRLQTLRMASCGLTAEFPKGISPLERVAPELRTLDVSDNDLGYKGWQGLLKKLQDSQLEHLIARNINLDLRGVVLELLRYPALVKQLKSVDIGGNPTPLLPLELGWAIVNLLQSNPKLDINVEPKNQNPLDRLVGLVLRKIRERIRRPRPRPRPTP